MLTASQKQVKEVLGNYGPAPDHVLVPIVQHIGGIHMSSSGVRSRRAELARKRHVTAAGSVKMPSGRQATVWKVR